MVATLLDGRYPGAELLHVEAAFSSSLSDMGTISLRKVWALTRLLLRVLWIRLRSHPTILYYHPAGGSKSAILRDVLLLALLRPLFRCTVFHFHARGLPKVMSSTSGLYGRMMRYALSAPDLVIGPSEVVVAEAKYLGPGRSLVIPNGTVGGRPKQDYKPNSNSIRILFLNLISPRKGVDWLIDSICRLRKVHSALELVLVGEFESLAYERSFLTRVAQLQLRDIVRWTGPVSGDDKWRAFETADIFCFPTIHPEETFGLVLVEAASCGLPIVASDVPGVRDVLTPGKSFALADPHAPFTLDHCLRSFLNWELRQAFGRAAHAEYCSKYTAQQYHSQIGAMFNTLSTSGE